MVKKKQPANKGIVGSVAGISGSKQAEEMLLREQIMLARTEGIAHVGSWEWDIATDTVTWSNELFRIFQRDPQEGAPSFAEQQAFYHPDDMACLRQAVEVAVADGTPYTLELRAIRKDGETRVCIARGVAEMALGGRPVRLVGSLQDITERKKAEEALKESEEKFSKAFKSAPIPMAISTLADGRYIDVNDSFLRFTGYSREEVIGLSSIEMTIWAKPGSRVRMLEMMRDQGKIHNSEYEFCMKSGEARLGLLSVETIRIGGQQCFLSVLKDITERKKAEEALKESEARYQRITEGLTDYLYTVRLQDGQAVETTHGQACKAVTGYTKEEFADDPNLWISMVVAEERGQVLERVQRILAGENIPPIEHRIVLKDGQIRWIRDTPILQFDSENRLVSYDGVIKDITNHKQAEEALREREARLRSLFETMSEGVVLIATDGQIISANSAAESILGLAHSQIEGRTYDSPKWEMLRPDGTPMPAEEMAGPRAMKEKRAVKDVVMGAVQPDGSVSWISVNAAPLLDEVGKLEGVVGTFTDITKRKGAEKAQRESEEKYRMVVESAQETIVILVDGMLKFANGRIEALTGYSREELTTRHFIEFIHPADRQMVADRYSQRLKGMDIPNKYTFRLISKPGDIKWAEVSATLIPWEDRHATMNFLTDITDRKRLEEEQQRVEKLEAIGMLAGGIAHDFNNILTAILGNISLARTEAAPGSELFNSLEQAEKASLRAKDLTVQLLTFSKGGAPVTKLTSLAGLLKDTAGFALRGSNVICQFSIPADLWHAKIDAGQVSQVIHNLVINAQQSMPTGGSIELLAENIALSETQSLGRGLPIKAGDYIRVAVADHGTGIPGDHLGKIFDPFFSTKQQGSGLGLATSFSIARNHDGHISVESELGSGSTFCLYLPASMETVTPEQAEKMTIKHAGKARILVMDDEQEVRKVAGRILKHIGYQDVEFAEDGAEAIKLYKAALESGHPFSVAILDLTIAGGMGGEVTIRKLLKIDPGAKAIVSSGYADDPVIAKYKKHGFSGVVAKPYTIDELRKAVQDVIGLGSGLEN